jgi:hypothetical protein
MPDANGKKKSFTWDYEENSIRGSFVNILLTVAYLVIAGLSLVFETVAKNVAQASTFLIGFYLVSFGVWATKKTVEIARAAKSIVPDKYGDMINKIFESISVNPANGNDNKEDKEDKKAEKEAAK